jgi:hypothetical protein
MQLDEASEVQTMISTEFEVELDYMLCYAYNQVSPQSNAPEMNACFHNKNV